MPVRTAVSRGGREILTMTSQRDEVAEPGDPGAVVRRVDAVTGALESLTGVFEQEERLTVVLQRVCQQAVHAIGEADLASVTLLRENQDAPYTAATAGDAAVALDAAQY